MTTKINPNEVKEYRRIKNSRLLQFINQECLTLMEHLPKPCTFNKNCTFFAIDEDNNNKIYTYTPFAKSKRCFNYIGEVILQIEIANIKQKQDIFDFCDTNKCLNFQLTNIFFNFRENLWICSRYLLLETIIEEIEAIKYEFKHDDLIYSCILPGKPIRGIYYVVERKNGDKIEQTIFDYNFIYPKIVKPQRPKKNIFSFFSNLFFSNTKHTSNRNGNEYDKL